MIELSSQGFVLGASSYVAIYVYKIRASSEGFSCLFSIVVVFEEMKCAVTQCHCSVLRESRK